MIRLLRMFSAIVVAAVGPALAQANDPAFKSILKTSLANFPHQSDRSTGYTAALARLDGEHTELVVYVSGHSWCGSGGCSLLVVADKAGSYRMISKTIGVELPVRVLATTNGGWHDIAVGSAEGTKRLMFNGWKYPINAYSFPSRRLAGNVAGAVVIPAAAKQQILFKWASPGSIKPP